jgi:protein TonB
MPRISAPKTDAHWLFTYHDSPIPTFLPGGYRTYQVRRANFYLSLLLHAGGLALLVFLTRAVARPPDLRDLPPRALDTKIYLPHLSANYADAGGRGGSPDRMPASRGTPPQISDIQFAPPEVLNPNHDPALPIPPTIVAAAPPLPPSDTLGDLSSILTVPSSGVRAGTGIGNSPDGGGGIGNMGGRFPSVGAGTGRGGGATTPILIYRVDPEFTDEARHARYQGVVIVDAEIGGDGLVRHARVARSVGMGLDQRAVDAVQQWRFEPARMNGKAVATLVRIEVSFRLF